MIASKNGVSTSSEKTHKLISVQIQQTNVICVLRGCHFFPYRVLVFIVRIIFAKFISWSNLGADRRSEGESGVSCQGRLVVIYSPPHVTVSQRPSQTGFLLGQKWCEVLLESLPIGTVARIILKCVWQELQPIKSKRRCLRHFWDVVKNPFLINSIFFALYSQ